MSDCITCPVERQCHYKYKPCDCVGQRKFTSLEKRQAQDYDYQPCRICSAPNDIGELCTECAKGNDPFGADLSAPGGWMIQDGRTRQ